MLPFWINKGVKITSQQLSTYSKNLWDETIVQKNICHGIMTKWVEGVCSVKKPIPQFLQNTNKIFNNMIHLKNEYFNPSS